MLLIAIDGACRRNGKPDCIAAGGVFIQHLADNGVVSTAALSNYEHGSTNQRGELLALLTSLDYIYTANQPALLVTDSEYLFNAMTKNWVTNWSCKGWLTAAGEPVKNRDIWESILHAYNKCVDITFYHIKGHCIPFGDVTAKKLLEQDRSGKALHKEVLIKYDTSKRDKLDAANELSVRNNGFAFEEHNLKMFVAANIVADTIATVCVDAADALVLS